MAAIATLLLREASSAARLSIRVLARRQYYHSALFRPLALGNRLSPELRGGSPYPSHPFSSLRHRSLDPPIFLKIIDSEIKYAEESHDHDRKYEIPNQFPFKIVDEPGTKAITLTRDYHGEHIEVSVFVPDLLTGEESEDCEDDDSKDNIDDAAEDDDSKDNTDDVEKGAQSSIELVVKFNEEDENGFTEEFYCTAYANEVTIDDIYILGKGVRTYGFFSECDEASQNAYYKYLESIGISPRTTNFLLEYMINKDRREYLIWLKELKDFIQKWELRIM